MEEEQKEGGGKGWPGQVKAAIAAVAVYLAIAFSLYIKLKHLPGPYYGGDLYAHHGFAINYIANGFWTDPYFINNYAFYPWLGNYLFIALSLLPGFTLMKAEIFVGLLTTALSAIAFYFLGWILFKNHTWSLAFMLLSLATRAIPDGAPNLVPLMITIPLWFAFWLKAEETNKLRDKLLSGLFMGLTSLAHVAFFLAAMFVFVFTIIVETLRQKEKKKACVAALKMYLPMLLAGFIVSLLFYGPIIVHYHAKTLNPLFQYNGPDIDTLGLGWALRTLYAYSFSFSSVAAAVLSILTGIGMIVCIMNWGKKTARYAILWYVGGFLAPLHHLLTKPLLDRWVLPSHMWGIWLSLFIFAVYGIITVLRFAEKKWNQAPKIIAVGVLILVAALFVQRYDEYNVNPWVQFGERLDSSTQAWLSLGKWMQEQTSPNAVVLTGDETCFAMNGVSGRKCVFVRRTHANYFVDVEQRYADGVVLLYGNNSELTRKLLDDYQVDYFLLDSYYMPRAQIFVEPRFEEYLKENNVTYSKIRERKDIATPNAKVFDLLAVPFQPMNRHLEPLLSPAAEFKVDGQTYLQLFRVNR